MNSLGRELLDVKDLVIEINAPQSGPVYPVRGLSFKVHRGEIAALVGESGCGKSVTALSIMGLLHPGLFRIKKGSVSFRGTDIYALETKNLRALRGRKISMVFQEPMTALNPVFTVGEQISEAIKTHYTIKKSECSTMVTTLLEQVGIPEPERIADSYPHQLSGGLRQRAVIAMGLSCDPELMIADEPTTALDVTVQAQILNLLRGLQKERGLGMLLITHNLGVVAEIADRVMVMYAGKIVEKAYVRDLFKRPLHPYTKGLMKALPYAAVKDANRLEPIKGTVPKLSDIPAGCSFAQRCELASEECLKQDPKLEKVDSDRYVACINWS